MTEVEKDAVAGGDDTLARLAAVVASRRGGDPERSRAT